MDRGAVVDAADDDCALVRAEADELLPLVAAPAEPPVDLRLEGMVRRWEVVRRRFPVILPLFTRFVKSRSKMDFVRSAVRQMLVAAAFYPLQTYSLESNPDEGTVYSRLMSFPRT